MTGHLMPTECDGTAEKPEIKQNVRETSEYAEALADPESGALLNTLEDIANLGRLHILNKNG